LLTVPEQFPVFAHLELHRTEGASSQHGISERVLLQLELCVDPEQVRM
jgi:hypothetical protein